MNQFTALGLTGVSDAARARVLSAVVDSKAAADVNTVSKLQSLADAVAQAASDSAVTSDTGGQGTATAGPPLTATKASA
mgnify:CR=1 FL=1